MTTFVLLLLGCSQSEVSYYSNPNVFTLQEFNNNTEIGDYQLSIVNGALIISTKSKEYEVSLPDNYSSIQSFHFSYDNRFLAYDVMGENRVKFFVVNLETGERINLSDTVGHLYDYDGYQSPFGIAWAPNKNVIAIIGGDNESARIDLYHLEGKQSSGGSFIFKDVYGIKWDSIGESIYYIVDSFENENMYTLYQTEIESDNYLLGGTVNVITEVNEEGFDNWLNKEG